MDKALGSSHVIGQEWAEGRVTVQETKKGTM